VRRRRQAGLTLAAAVLGLGIVLAGARPSNAASKRLTIDPPGHGTFSQPFVASYTLGKACQPGATVAFQWDPGGPVIGQAPAIDFVGCSASGVPLVPPLSRPDLLQPGPHTVLAAVVEGGRTRPGSEAAAGYVLDPAEGGPGGGPTPITFAQSPDPNAEANPASTPTPAPTPVPTVAPLQPITATFPPHNCENGVPDGTTPCPSPNGGVLAISATPPPLAGAVATSSSSGPPAGVVVGLAVALLVAVLAMSAAWLRGGRRSSPANRLPGD
jgi:hypothetical protein